MPWATPSSTSYPSSWASPPRVVWEQTYDAGSRRKPGQTSRASGTTPTLMAGERHVAITDNADPRMHVVVYDTSAGAGDKEVCRVPVFAPDRSAGDNSLIAIGRSLFVESNYGYNLFDATFGRSTQPGLTRIDVTDDGWLLHDGDAHDVEDGRCDRTRGPIRPPCPRAATVRPACPLYDFRPHSRFSSPSANPVPLRDSPSHPRFPSTFGSCQAP